jgi:hypothetical protein
MHPEALPLKDRPYRGGRYLYHKAISRSWARQKTNRGPRRHAKGPRFERPCCFQNKEAGIRSANWRNKFLRLAISQSAWSAPPYMRNSPICVIPCNTEQFVEQKMQCVLETCSIQGFIRESRRARNLGADSFHENLDAYPVASSGLSCCRFCRPNVRETVKGTARPNNPFNWRRAKSLPDWKCT